MPPKDANFIVTIQLTLIGIVLIAGLYLLWKALSRIEEKIDMMMTDKENQVFLHPMNMSDSMTHMQDDEFMKAVFREQPGDDQTKIEFFTLSKPFEEPVPKESVLVEEIAPSVSVKEYSKTKLRQMNLEKLKELCAEKELSTEGTKNQLIERLLAE